MCAIPFLWQCLFPASCFLVDKLLVKIKQLFCLGGYWKELYIHHTGCGYKWINTSKAFLPVLKKMWWSRFQN